MEIIFLPTLSKDDDVYWMLVDQTFLKTRLKRAACLEQEVFVQPVKQVVSLWWTFGGGTKLSVGTGSTVKPSVSLLPPSSLQLSGGSASLLCLLSGYSPQGAQVSWTVGGSEVKEGVLTSGEVEKNGHYSRSSTLTLSKTLWDQVEKVVCKVSHSNQDQRIPFLKSQCEG
ncbi:hypothetical protein NFI96_031230 [Prochilodus magdalenae]|nr:hypothetical protein NFI96_031230 [Prochilodus magdalenae]